MSSPNVNMRDPIIYRNVHASHPHTGDAWCIYPMYDFAHPLEDALENITHSICTMEFEDHRPLYDWFIQNCECKAVPHQYEFARLGLTHTLMSKRYLKKLVEDGVVSGWDDPRMPTLSGVRRRGYTPAAIRDFCDRIGVAKANSEVDLRLLEHCVREDLNSHAARIMGVLRPMKLTITNYPEGKTETFMAEDLPGSEEKHEITFSRNLFIEQEDFMEVPLNNKFFRMFVGGEVRLKNAYIIKCESVVKDNDGNVAEVLCTYDPDSSSGGATAGRKIKGTLHWAEASTAVPATVRLYDYLIDDNGELNEDSLHVLDGVLVEPYAKIAAEKKRFQFIRQGYFALDEEDSKSDALVFNQIVVLKDSFAKTMDNNK
ncbi:MAG: glutamate--tRNA ligase family protein, partial [Eubacteriales bacterium]